LFLSNLKEDYESYYEDIESNKKDYDNLLLKQKNLTNTFNKNISEKKTELQKSFD